MNCPQDYVGAIIKSFRTPVEVVDIFVVPDYSAVFENCGGDISNYAKADQTQLQFIFSAVPTCDHYPTGVKVNYRSYSSDEIIEIRNGTHANFPHLNIHPCRRTVQTFPLAVPERNIPDGKSLETIMNESLLMVFVGTHLLKKLPEVSKDQMKFQKFRKDGREEFDNCMKSVIKFFGQDSRESKQWQKWAEGIPLNDDVDAFVQR